MNVIWGKYGWESCQANQSKSNKSPHKRRIELHTAPKMNVWLTPPLPFFRVQWFLEVRYQKRSFQHYSKFWGAQWHQGLCHSVHSEERCTSRDSFFGQPPPPFRYLSATLPSDSLPRPASHSQMRGSAANLKPPATLHEAHFWAWILAIEKS